MTEDLVSDNVTDKDLNQRIFHLTNEKNIAQARKMGDARLGNLNQTQVNQLRHRAKNDLFFLAYGILGYTKLSPNLHGSVCSWMMRNRHERFKELLLPRGHYKTTLCTISDGVRIALPNTNESPYWPENLGSEIRVLLGHEAKAKAEQFLVAIAGHFLSNPLLMALFPEIVPSARVQRINRSELELPRDGVWPEATYSTMGTGGRSQGLHFNYLKLDDLIGDEARDSKTVMKGAKLWFDNIQAFFSSFVEDHLDVAGTRWAYDDLYNHIHEMYGSSILKYIRGAEEMTTVGYDDAGNAIREPTPIFPEQFTTESLRILKKNKIVWASQYANDPESGVTEFDPEWLMFYKWVEHNELRFTRDGQDSYRRVEDMDICILIDPAMTNLGGIVVTGMDSDGNVFILDAIKEDWYPPDVVDLLFKLVNRWDPRVVVFEKVLFSGLFEYWVKDRMKIVGTYFRVEMIGVRGIDKDTRIRSLANYFAAHQIFFHMDKQKDLETEYKQFGASDNTHMLDALAQGTRGIWRKGFNRGRIDEQTRAEEEVLKGRDGMTGYSRIRG